MEAERWREMETVRSHVQAVEERELTLADRLSRLEGKVDLVVKLVMAQIGVGGSLLVALIAAIVAFLLTRGH